MHFLLDPDVIRMHAAAVQSSCSDKMVWIPSSRCRVKFSNWGICTLVASYPDFLLSKTNKAKYTYNTTIRVNYKVTKRSTTK